MKILKVQFKSKINLFSGIEVILSGDILAAVNFQRDAEFDHSWFPYLIGSADSGQSQGMSIRFTQRFSEGMCY